MKQQHACPKCAGRKIWILEPHRINDDTFEGAPMRLVPHQPEGAPNRFQVERRRPEGTLDLYVCAGCGYSEYWARDFADLREGRDVRLLDSSNNRGGPFR